MSGEMREKDQADFDMDRFIDMFDEALASRDPRVIETLRSLLMITTLTRPEPYSGPAIDRQHGPLRRLAEDVRQAHRRISDLEDMVRMVMRERSEAQNAKWPRQEVAMEKYTMVAAAQMAQSIDNDIMQSIARKINTPEPNLVQPKGLIKK